MKIITEKVVVGGVKCRKIVKFDGFPLEQAVVGADGEKFKRTTSSCLKIFNGTCVKLGDEQHRPKPESSVWFYPKKGYDIDLGGTSDIITEESVIPEITFQKFVALLKRVVSHWSGTEEVQI